MWGDAIGGLRAGERGDDHPERQRRRQRARRRARDRLPHGDLDRQPGGARRQRLAGGARRDRGRALGGDVPRGRGRRQKLASALALCAERGVGVAVLKVGSLGGRRPSCRRAHRARWPATPASSGRWSRRRAPPGPRSRTSCSSWPARWPSPGAAGIGRAGSPCSPAPAATPASPPTSPSSVGVDLPPLAAETTRRLRAAAARGGDDRQPARLHGDDLGGHRAARGDDRDRRRGPRDRPGADALLRLSRTSPWTRAWDDVRAGIVAGAAPQPASPVLVASTLPDLINEDAVRELAEHGVPYIAGLGKAIRAARRSARPAGEPARLREIAAAAAPPAALDGRARVARRGRGQGAARGRRGLGARGARGERRPDDAAAAAAELGFPVALKLVGPRPAAQERGGRAASSGLEGEAAVRAAAGELLALEARRRRQAARRADGRLGGRRGAGGRRPARRRRPGAGRRPWRHLDRGPRRRRDRPRCPPIAARVERRSARSARPAP